MVQPNRPTEVLLEHAGAQRPQLRGNAIGEELTRGGKDLSQRRDHLRTPLLFRVRA